MKEKGVVCWHTSTAASNLMVLRTTEGSPASSATSAGFPSHLSFFDKANEASIFAVGEPGAFQFSGVPWREAGILFFDSGSLGTERRDL